MLSRLFATLVRALGPDEPEPTPQMTLTPDQLDRLGRLADKADNFSHAAKMPLPDSVHKTCLLEGMGDIRNELRAIYVEASGENPWKE